MDALEAIHTRRSIGKHLPDTPPRGLIEQLLAAAVQAPNHHETQPWRFFVVAGRAREEMGAVLEEALRRRMAGEEQKKVEGLAAAERAKPLRSPVLIVVGVKHDVTEKGGERILPVEDLEASAAAIENMLLAAHALGLAAQWRTGDGAFDPYVKAWFGLSPSDEIAGIVYVGYRDPERDGPHRGPREWRAKTEWRGWD
ncbi:MAG TPA: nitroreductase [Dehalococcoidia bacterium]|nr:nitroreductase [Dehalococcoidia bacterium]